MQPNRPFRPRKQAALRPAASSRKLVVWSPSPQRQLSQRPRALQQLARPFRGLRLQPPLSSAPEQQLSARRQSNRDADGIGAVVRSRVTKTGLSDIIGHKVAWVAGYTYVGNGTNGTNNAVYFQTKNALWLIQGFGVTSSGLVPIGSSDGSVGASYVKDIEKHFARKIIRRMKIHVDSLQPSTANNMMAVIAPSRGPGGLPASVPIALATAAVTSNTVENVSSMSGAFTVNSWESRTVDITRFIAGGSGALQNEFEIGNTAFNGQFYTTTAVASGDDGVDLVPACFGVAGNSTTAALAGTLVHQITIEQEVDLLDYVGGMAQAIPVE